MGKLFVSVMMLLCMTSCTYNVSMAHTSGTADDVIDDTASNTPNVSPTVTVPLTPGSSIGITKP
jgi:hypothetical protein